MNDIPISTLLAALVVLLLISAFFSASETGMMAINRYRLQHLARKGHRGARRSVHLLNKNDKLPGVIVLGHSLANIAAASLVTVITIRMFGLQEWAMGLAILALSLVILVFSEMIPKMLGAAYPEKTVLTASIVLKPWFVTVSPLMRFLNRFGYDTLRLLHVQPDRRNQEGILEIDELRSLVQESEKLLPAAHRSILLHLLDLEEITVDNVMTPRNQMEAIDMEADVETLARQISTSHHTRLPLFRGQLDDIAGILNVRDAACHMRGGELDVEALLLSRQQAYFIPSGTSLFAQLRHFQQNRHRVGLVVDEYGELMGLLTPEDILAEIVGELKTATPASGFVAQADGSWLVEGASLVRSINRKLGLQLPLEGPKTLNGLVLEQLEDIPEPGTTLKIAGYAVEIMQVQERAIKMARIFPVAIDWDTAQAG